MLDIILNNSSSAYVSRINESPSKKEQLNSLAESGVYVKHLVHPEGHTAFMKLAMPSLLGQLFTGIICCSLLLHHNMGSAP